MSLKKIDLPNEKILIYEFQHIDGDVIKEHHHQVHQLLYVVEGEGKITLDGKGSSIQQDNAALILPNSVHSIVSDSKLTVLVLAFVDSVFDSSFQQELLNTFFNNSKLFKLNPFSGSELRQLLRKMLFEHSNTSPLHILAMKIFLSEIMIVLARAQQPLQIHDANSLRAERIRHYIDTHYFEILSSNDIASKQGISMRYINNIFKEQYKITPMQYLTNIRIEMAKKMLSETDKDIASICFELGFETVSTFYRIFKTSIKTPPNKYRKIHRIQESSMSDHLKP
jgi:AraC-like DNA-binding protein/quercetin dioxygenase-like cupin family protein